jgi:hypothetical protein
MRDNLLMMFQELEITGKTYKKKSIFEFLIRFINFLNFKIIWN